MGCTWKAKSRKGMLFLKNLDVSRLTEGATYSSDTHHGDNQEERCDIFDGVGSMALSAITQCAKDVSQWQDYQTYAQYLPK